MTPTHPLVAALLEAARDSLALATGWMLATAARSFRDAWRLRRDSAEIVETMREHPDAVDWLRLELERRRRRPRPRDLRGDA